MDLGPAEGPAVGGWCLLSVKVNVRLYGKVESRHSGPGHIPPLERTGIDPALSA